MVLGLEDIKARNAQAFAKPLEKKIEVPAKYALCPHAARRWVNRPWTPQELGETGAVKAKAQGAAAALEGRVLTDENRTDAKTSGK